MEFKDLLIDHDYYCHTSNYYSNEARTDFDTWAEFYEEYKEADVDMNLVFRWDIRQRTDDADNLIEEYEMEIFIMGQRKGMYKPQCIASVTPDDLPQIISYLTPHFDKLKSIWNPFQ